MTDPYSPISRPVALPPPVRTATLLRGVLLGGLILAGMAGCSGSPPQPRDEDAELAEIDLPETIAFTLTNLQTDEPLGNYLLPTEAFRIVALEQARELSDGEDSLGVMRLILYIVDGEVLLPREAYWKFVQSKAYANVTGMTEGYEHRLRSFWDSDYVDYPLQASRSGIFEYEAEKLNFVNPKPGEIDAYISEDPDFDFAVIICKGVLQSNGSYDMTDGRCTVKYPMTENIGLGVTFHQSLRADWMSIANKTEARIRSLEQH